MSIGWQHGLKMTMLSRAFWLHDFAVLKGNSPYYGPSFYARVRNVNKNYGGIWYTIICAMFRSSSTIILLQVNIPFNLGFPACVDHISRKWAYYCICARCAFLPPLARTHIDCHIVQCRDKGEPLRTAILKIIELNCYTYFVKGRRGHTRKDLLLMEAKDISSVATSGNVMLLSDFNWCKASLLLSW